LHKTLSSARLAVSALPDDTTEAATRWENWGEWPLWMILPAVAGFIICLIIRRAIPDKAKKAAH
jgi:hypothetical protein